MNKTTERLVGVAVVVATAVLALGVSQLLTGARDRGIDALERSKADEVTSAARSFNQRVSGTLTGAQGLTARNFEMTVGSVADQASLDEILALIADPTAGFFLVDAGGLITAGVLLDGATGMGDPYDAVGYDAATATESFASGVGAILAVQPGITTSGPVSPFVFPVFDFATGALRGSFVFESEVGPETDFSAEIAQLSTEGGASWAFLDQVGTVIASSDLTSIGKPVDDIDLVELEVGIHPEHRGDVVVVGEVPVAAWRLVFRQDRSEFISDLSGPLDRAGTIVVLVLVVAGGAVALGLVSRLRAVREEQARLVELTARQEEFISIVSHELRTPVAGVVGFLQTALDHWDELDDTERQSSVHRSMLNAQRLQALTRDVLEAEQADRGRLQLVTERTDLGVTLRSSIDLTASALGGRRIEVSVPAQPVELPFDRQRIGQVLSNLIENAHKNSPPNAAIEVAASVSGGWAKITVTDHGRGLDTDTADAVFEKFTRGRDRAGVEGTGLGLYVSRSIVEAHGGRIWARTGDDGGAVFGFELPMSGPSSEAPRPVA